MKFKHNDKNIILSISRHRLLEIIDDLSAVPDVRILYPIQEFTVAQTLFRLCTYDKDTFLKTMTEYDTEKQKLQKEVLRLTTRMNALNDKFCNENWLRKCPTEVQRREYNTLCTIETDLDLTYKKLQNIEYINIYIIKK